MTQRLYKETTGGTRCAQCGYPLGADEDISLIIASGDLIHTSCWEEYAEDNKGEFLSPL